MMRRRDRSGPPEPAPAPAKILIIEDDQDISLALSTLFRRSGYEATVANDGLEGLRCFHQWDPDLVILDIGLPALDGWRVLERIRELSQAPILMLTARDTEMDKVRGLRGGADDYLTKPFSNQELLARVDAHLRRQAVASASVSAPPPAPPSREPLYRDSHVVIDMASHFIEVRGRSVDLTPLEFRLLDVLMRHRGAVLTTEQLLQMAWQDPTATGPDRVKFTILRLRKKLGWEAAGEGPIETVRGFGYRFSDRI
jgi:DNA-binding response OmpR family regulator